MAIIKLGSLNFENYNLVARPEKTFASSSLGVTGSILLMKDASPSLKDISRSQPSSVSEVNQYDEALSIDLSRLVVESPEDALQKSNETKQGLRYKKRQEILRTIPGTKFDKNFLKKNTVRKVLFPYYRTMFPSMEWAYTNYNTLNFYENENVPSDSALIYPAGTGSDDSANFYAPTGSFSFDFYVKPTNNSHNIAIGQGVSPGTIMHMSGCFAISLVTGSSTDATGLPDKYRLLLQLSSSANVKPDFCKISPASLTASTDAGNSDHLFVSSDNSLHRDRWNHVCITWPGAINNSGTGSFFLNGVKDAEFASTASSIMISTSPKAGVDDPNAVFVGNYYHGTNAGNQAIALFFNNNVSGPSKEGLTNLVDSVTDPAGFSFSNPLRAEIHDLKIFNSFKTLREIFDHQKKGRGTIPDDLLFYVPPLFVKESRKRNVLRTPFVADANLATDDPFNVLLSFGLGSLDVNLENFTREFVRKEYPRLYNLSSSATNTAVYATDMTANDVIYKYPAARKKLRTILPCDNGFFRPNYGLLLTGSDSLTKFTDSDGVYRPELISLTTMIGDENVSPGLTVNQLVGRDADGELSFQWENVGSPTYPTGDDNFIKTLEGSSPEDPTLSPGTILTVLQRTGDTSSSEIVIFDVSNMFYGDRITPESLVVEDLLPTGSHGTLSFRLKDNGQGSLYRSDIEEGQPAATWSSVGNVLYDEGLIVVKSPNLGFFGKDSFKITFKGERKVYVYEVTIPVEATMHNSSSNPTYQHLKPTDYSNEIAQRFNYITGVNLHDDNLNIVGKASLSQPFMKREDDRIVIKLRMDF